MTKTKKTIVLIVVLVVVLALSLAIYKTLSKDDEAARTKAQIGKDTAAMQEGEEPIPAPDFAVKTSDKEETSFKDLTSNGKPTIINFWATWCGPCRQELPDYNRVFKEYGDRVNFLMVNLTDGNRDTVERVQNFIEETGYSFPVYFDIGLQAASVYDLYSIPLSVIIDKDGNIVAQRVGALNKDNLNSYIDELL